MSDDSTNPGSPGGSGPNENSGGPPGGAGGQGGGEGGGKRRRKRRRGGKRRRSGEASGQAPGPSKSAGTEKTNAPGGDGEQSPDTNHQTQDTPPRADTGDKPRRGPKPGRRDDRAGSPPKPRTSSRDDRPAPPKPGSNNAGDGGGPKARKKRKPRTKQCVHCFTPCTVVHKVRLDYRKQWVFICDICWPTRCIDNPHYEYQAMWVGGRIVRPGGSSDGRGQGQRPERSSQSTPPPAPTPDAPPPSNGPDALATTPPPSPPSPPAHEGPPTEASGASPNHEVEDRA